MDGAGNHSAWLPAKNPEIPTLLLGSHLDSVPSGGRYDGALGVMAALEVLRSLRDTGLELRYNLEAIDFTDEEGAHVGLLGSQALTGRLTPEQLLNPASGRPALEEGLQRAGLDETGIFSARRDPASLLAYLELHIEQGPHLVRACTQIGIVTTIVGMRSFTITYTGQADHAGTTPLDARKDAGLGTADFMVKAHARVRHDFPGCVLNFGQVHFHPGAFNIVPAIAEFKLEFRSADLGTLNLMERTLLDLTAKIAEEHGLGISVQSHDRLEPTDCSPLVQKAIADTCGLLELKHIALSSGAGHDAMMLGRICQAGMIFVPSSGGSHCPAEYAAWDDCVNGANVLLNSAVHLINQANL
jgi:hydantoinase/carbamoylase family amidase